MPRSERFPAQDSDTNSDDFHHSSILTEENLKHLDSPSPSSGAEYPQTKDSPLTDIGTSPPPFEIPSSDERRAHSRDSYESSELSDLGDDDSEAETDKMDFLNEDSNSGNGDRDSDLQRLSQLTDLANLQELDSDDSDVSQSVSYLASGSDAEKPAQNGEIAGESPESAKRPRETESGADSDDAEEHSSSENEAEPAKRRKIADAKSNGPEDDTDSKVDADVKAKTSVVHDIIENGSEPLSWPAADSVTAITPVDSSTVTKGETSATEIAEQPSSDTELSRSEAEVDEGATADVEDVVKQEQKEDQEEEEEAAAESGEEAESPPVMDDVDIDQQRKSAVEELIAIENDFSYLRDKLYRDKLSLLEHEMQLCLDGSHPELLQIYYKVNEFYQDNIKLANATLNYSLKCINTETIATRTAIHQNFMKNLAGTRNEMITETTSSWYKINKEWNYLDSAVADYNFTAIPSSLPESSNMPFVAGGSSAEYYQENGLLNRKLQRHNTIVELVHRRNCVNAQLGILDGLKEFHGIPSAVSNSLLDDAFPVDELLLRKASPDEIKEDLQAMGIY